jgi:hypothetical protein
MLHLILEDESEGQDLFIVSQIFQKLFLNLKAQMVEQPWLLAYIFYHVLDIRFEKMLVNQNKLWKLHLMKMNDENFELVIKVFGKRNT